MKVVRKKAIGHTVHPPMLHRARYALMDSAKFAETLTHVLPRHSRTKTFVLVVMYRRCWPLLFLASSHSLVLGSSS